jgi:hypothetical protein
MIKRKVKTFTPVGVGSSFLFDHLGSQEPHSTDNLEFCPRFFYVAYGTISFGGQKK